MKKIFFYISLMVLLSSCMVGPDFTSPEAPSDPDYAFDTSGDRGGQSINPHKELSATWWYEFNSTALNEVMAHALEKSHTLAAQQATLAEAREFVNAVSGQQWPDVSLTAAAGRQKYGVALFGPSDFNIPPFTYYEIGPNISYALDLFGGTRRMIEKQQALVEYQQQQLHAAYLSLTGNIAISAFTIATLNAQIEILKNLIAKDESYLALVQKAVHLGIKNEFDVLRSRSQLIRDQVLLPELEKQLQLAKNALNALVGQTPTVWQPPDFELDDFTLPQELPLVLPSALVHARPDILAAEALLHAANSDVGIATANFYPKITLTGNIFQEALTPSDLFKSSSDAWGVLGDLTVPLFQGGTLRAQKRAAEHAYESAYASYQQVVLQAFLQVRDVLYTLQQDSYVEKLTESALQTEQSTFDLAQVSQRVGNVGDLEVIEAERSYHQAQFDYVQTRGQRYLNTVQFYLVLGGSSSR